MSFSDDEDFDDIYGESPKVDQKKDIGEPSAPEIKEPSPVKDNGNDNVNVPAEAPSSGLSATNTSQPADSTTNNTGYPGSAADQAVVAALSASLNNNNNNDPQQPPSFPMQDQQQQQQHQQNYTNYAPSSLPPPLDYSLHLPFVAYQNYPCCNQQLSMHQNPK